MKLPRRKFLHLAANVAAIPAVLRYSRAQAYPSRPVQIVIGFPAGNTTDIVARLIGQRLSERLGQPIVIENRPGAGTNIGTEAVVRAPPDGHTLLLATSVNAMNASLYQHLNFNFVRDITPVARIGGTAFVIVVTPSIPAKSIPEFIAYAKANPDKITMASAGVGSTNHIFGELFKSMTGINMLHVPYRSAYMPDLLSGRVHVAFTTVAQSIGYIKDSRLRALAVTTSTPWQTLPNIPTVGASVPGYEASGWQGVGAPKNTSNEIIKKLNNEINAVLAEPNVKDRLIGAGVEPTTMSPAEFGRFIANETEKWGNVIRTANIKPE